MRPLKSLPAVIGLYSLLMLLALPACAEPNINLVQQWYAHLDTRPFNAEALKGFLADGLIDHNSDAHRSNNDAGLSNDKEVRIYIHSQFAQGVPNGRYQLQTVEMLHDKRVLVHWHYKGRHSGNLFDIPATHKNLNFAGITIFRIQQSEITELWHVEETDRLLEQLGIFD